MVPDATIHSRAQRPRQRYATDIEPVAAAAQILQQLGPRVGGNAEPYGGVKQIEPIRIQARDQFLFGEKVNCETGERACCRMSRVIRQPRISGNPVPKHATLGGAAVLPITTRGRALATAALPIVLRNFRLDPDVDTDGTHSDLPTTTTNKKRLFEFISVSLLFGLTAAIGTIVFSGWLADEVLDGETRQFDEVTRAAVHQSRIARNDDRDARHLVCRLDDLFTTRPRS